MTIKLDDCLLGLGWKAYHDFSVLVDSLLNRGTSTIFRQSKYYQNEWHYLDNLDDALAQRVTGWPLGVKTSDVRSLAYFDNFHMTPYFAGAEKDHKLESEVHLPSFSIKEDEVYEEFLTPKWEKVYTKIVSHLEVYGIAEHSLLFEPFLMRHFGVIANCASLYLRRKEGLLLSFYKPSDQKKLESSVKYVISQLKKGLPVQDDIDRNMLIGLFEGLVKRNVSDNADSLLYRADAKTDNPELTASLIDYAVFIISTEGAFDVSFAHEFVLLFERDIELDRIERFSLSLENKVSVDNSHDHKNNKKCASDLTEYFISSVNASDSRDEGPDEQGFYNSPPSY
ncbi:MAG: hypothetical protein ACJAS1_002349 [Oleiphilaceae bacterium]|jgi:hypothetical protein